MVFCWMADRLQQFLAEKLYNEKLSEWFTSPEVNCGRQWVVFTTNYRGQANIMLNMTGRIISVDGIYSCLAIPLRGANKDPTTPLSQLASLLNFISIAQEYWTRKTQTLADVNFVALNRRKHTFFIAVCGCGGGPSKAERNGTPVCYNYVIWSSLIEAKYSDSVHGY